MKSLLTILAALTLLGCESGRVREVSHRQEPPFVSGAAALVYTPPYAVDERELGLDRDGRGPVALGGVETTIYDTTWVYQDDRQRHDQWGDWSRFERRAVSTSITVRQR